MVTTVVITGKFVDIFNETDVGHTIFTARPNRLVDSEAKLIISGFSKKAIWNSSGEIAVNLRATDDPDIDPAGFTYSVASYFNKKKLGDSYDISVPIESAETGIDLSTITPVEPSEGTTSYYTTSEEFSGLEERVEILEEDIENVLILGEISTTAYRGDRGKIAYDHSQLTTGNPHNVTKSDVGLSNVTNTSDVNKPISTAQQTALDLKADLVSGLVPSSQLPSYVDDVLEYANVAAFPVTGVSGKIYVAIDTNTTYRWGGSFYVLISDTIALGETSSTAYRGDRGKIAYDYSQSSGLVLGTTPQGKFADLATRLNKKRVTSLNGSPSELVVPGVIGISTSTLAMIANTDYYFPFFCEDYITFDRLVSEVTVAAAGGSTARVALYNADAYDQPTGTVIEDFGTFSIASTGLKNVAPSAGSLEIPGGRYLLSMNPSANATLRVLAGSLHSQPVSASLGGSMLPNTKTVARANGAFPSTGLAWTTIGGGATGGTLYPVFLRITAVG